MAKDGFDLVERWAQGTRTVGDFGLRRVVSQAGLEASIVIMLDPEWDEKALKRKKHPIHVIAELERELSS